MLIIVKDAFLIISMGLLLLMREKYEESVKKKMLICSALSFIIAALVTVVPYVAGISSGITDSAFLSFLFFGIAYLIVIWLKSNFAFEKK